MKIIIYLITLCGALTVANAQQLTDSSGFKNTSVGNNYPTPGYQNYSYTFPNGQGSSTTITNFNNPTNENNNFNLQNSNLNNPIYLNGIDSSGKEQFQQKENINTY